MSSEIAIKVENLSKCYEIYDQPRDRLKQFVLPRGRSLLGLPPKRYYREFWALKDVSFEVRKGETVGVVGRNGSGKSTLLQTICGTLNPTAGTIRTVGRVAALLELGSGFNPEFTGRENVYMNAAVLGLTKDQIDSRFTDISAFADIGEFIEHPVKTYSSGMLMRLAFAVIAHVDAEILIVDEALSVGDAFFTQKCMRFLREFMNRGTVLFVSHDSGAVVNLCNRAIIIEDGSLVDVGAPKEITKRYLASQHGIYRKSNETVVSEVGADDAAVRFETEHRDMREDLIRNTKYRNDIELFDFPADFTGYGVGGAEIISVTLSDDDGVPFSWIIGGEEVTLRIGCRAMSSLHMPIIGFQVRDRLGQVLFGDNTYLAYRESPFGVSAGEELRARFTFRLPLLPTGDYSISVAIAEGSQEKHVQHHWIHEALIFKVHASSIRFGLIGLPMKRILLERA